MKHKEIIWNPYTKKWFCVVCGRASDHISEADARAEVEMYECQLPARGGSKNFSRNDRKTAYGGSEKNCFSNAKRGWGSSASLDKLTNSLQFSDTSEIEVG